MWQNLSSAAVVIVAYFSLPVATFCMLITFIGIAPITQLGTCVIKIVTFKGGHLSGKSDFHAIRNCS